MTLADAVERFDRAVSGARREDALDTVEQLLAEGVDPLTVLLDVVAAVQREVGMRWQRGEWSVAQEHAATAVSVAALETVARSASGTRTERGRVVVACAEHEWHAVPASILAAGLRTVGWDVTLLGASTPTSRLGRYLQELGPDATAVSCSVAVALPAARAFIEASRATGIPVMAGGSAFGRDDRRATALGATAWAHDLRAALEVVETLPVVVRPAEPLPREVTREQSALRDAHHHLVEAVVFRWQQGRNGSPHGGGEGSSQLLREVADHALHAVVGAVLTGDGRLLEETAHWSDTVLRARGHDERALPVLGDSMAAELHDFRVAARLWDGYWPARG